MKKPRASSRPPASPAPGRLSPSMQGRLIRAARAAARASYSPYSHFPVGAAVLASSGRIYAGCNVENASFGLCNCAERTALFSAVAAGERRFHAVAVFTPTATPTLPCGACRQVINEFAADAIIVSACQGGAPQVTSTPELLPHAFGPANLKPGTTGRR